MAMFPRMIQVVASIIAVGVANPFAVGMHVGRVGMFGNIPKIVRLLLVLLGRTFWLASVTRRGGYARRRWRAMGRNEAASDAAWRRSLPAVSLTCCNPGQGSQQSDPG
jgi:hypothetical protein